MIKWGFILFVLNIGLSESSKQKNEIPLEYPTEEYEVADFCASNPCLNKGTCTNLVSGFSCTCLKGFEGTTCQKEINECSSTPCSNGGSCTDQINGYTCQCAKGWNGNNCNTDINECSSNPCSNGGSCTDQINGYTCQCPAGWEGTNCETDVDDCASNVCQNNGTCVDLVNGFNCTCMEGYEGERCENDINECLSGPCLNNSICIDEVAGYKCECIDGYEGEACLNETDECLSAPCMNDGVCTDQFNNFTCQCAPGFEGDFCETDIDECVSDPCKNGGTCRDRINGFHCACATDFIGPDCSENPITDKIRDCSYLYATGEKIDGIYRIKVNENEEGVQAYCDMTNGGWTVIQRHSTNFIHFEQNFATYASGFGYVGGRDFWWGNEKIHQFTTAGNFSLRAEFIDMYTDELYTYDFDTFIVEGANNSYRVTFGGFSGSHDWMRSPENSETGNTFDTVNHNGPNNWCSEKFGRSGWWYSPQCFTMMPNSPICDKRMCDCDRMSVVAQDRFCMMMKSSVLKIKH